MSPFIKDASVQAVLSAANIVDVVSGYTSLRKRGATYSGLCPFHQEKTPSFTVSADKGLYYCFGCGEGGDIVRFVERMENLSFAEAVEQLGERFGVPVEFEEGAGLDPPSVGEGGYVLSAVPLGNRKRSRRPRVSGEAGTGSGGLPDVPRGFLAGRMERAPPQGVQRGFQRPGVGRCRSADPPGGQDLRPVPGTPHVPAGRS
jgi:hypothetical protein